MTQEFNYVEVTPIEAVKHIEYCIKRNIPFFLHGSTSTAKSFSVRKAAERLNRRLIDCRLSSMESVDVRGLPKLPDTIDENTRVHWIPPDIFPREGDPDSVLFMDELLDADVSLQAPCYQIFNDRQCGSLRIPDNCALGAASNYRTDFGLANRMAVPLKNRFLHLHVHTPTEQFLGIAPQLGYHPSVIAFLRWMPSALNIFNDMTEENRQYVQSSYAFNTSRSWLMLSQIMFDHENEHVDSYYPLITGAIGTQAATAFRGYIKYYQNAPHPEDIIANPTTTPVSDTPQIQYAVITSLIEFANKSNIKDIMTYVNRMPKEMQSAFVVDVLKNDESLIEEDCLIEWSINNSSCILPTG